MSPIKVTSKTQGLPATASAIGPALAHVLERTAEKEIVLGQAWLSGTNQLATCGHVVDKFVQTPQSLIVRFPASGNRYPVSRVILHPGFMRQPGGLVMFDAAILYVDLAFSERSARPLPIRFNQPPGTGQPLAAVRYPTHLGNLTAAPSALTQVGAMLGLLRQHDGFHLLHDLALAPGDSGAAIFDGKAVVAVHCGDTATLPGLNLPTTAIRLALWIDAFRQLDVQERLWFSPPSLRSLVAHFSVALIVALVLSLGWITIWQEGKQPALMPIDVTFNKPLKSYKDKDLCKVTVCPRTKCFLYVFSVTETKGLMSVHKVYMVYPPYQPNSYNPLVRAKTPVAFGGTIDPGKGTLHLVAFRSNIQLMTQSDFSQPNPETRPLTITGDELVDRVKDLQEQNPSGVLHVVMDAPTAN